MKAVLMSIHPKWCEKIFRGEKTIEVRKTAPKLETPFTVYVYQTRHKCKRGDLSLIVDALDEIFGCGKVIGSFVCNKIYSFITFGAGAVCIDSDWNQIPPERVIKETCLTEQQIMDYLERGIGNYEGYGWHITEANLFDTPKELSEFYIPCKWYEKGNGCPEDCGFFKQDGCTIDRTDDFCEGKRLLTRPPQSWCYVEAYRDHSGDHNTHHGI